MIPQAEITAEGWKRDVSARNKMLTTITREWRQLRADMRALTDPARSPGAIPEGHPLRHHAGWRP